MPTTAKSGSRSRMLDHDKALPCGSASTSSTRPPATASVAATLTATVVLPTPPLRLSTPMIIALNAPIGAGTSIGGYRNEVRVRSVSIRFDQADSVSPAAGFRHACGPRRSLKRFLTTAEGLRRHPPATPKTRNLTSLPPRPRLRRSTGEPTGGAVGRRVPVPVERVDAHITDSA